MHVYMCSYAKKRTSKTHTNAYKHTHAHTVTYAHDCGQTQPHRHVKAENLAHQFESNPQKCSIQFRHAHTCMSDARLWTHDLRMLVCTHTTEGALPSAYLPEAQDSQTQTPAFEYTYADACNTAIFFCAKTA
jgi:hypothetical protein